MRVLIFCLVAMLLLFEAGCASAPEKEPSTLSEWGGMSRPKF
jgi:hypothetical protein